MRCVTPERPLQAEKQRLMNVATASTSHRGEEGHKECAPHYHPHLAWERRSSSSFFDEFFFRDAFCDCDIQVFIKSGYPRKPRALKNGTDTARHR